MFRRFSLAGILITGTLAALPAFCQDANSYLKSEATVQEFGSFLKSTTSDGVRQSDTNSGGILANYRYFFTKNLGAEVDYGWTRDTQSYRLPTGPFGVKSDQHEVFAAGVYRHQVGSLMTFVEAGAGGLVFAPVNSLYSTQARAAFVYGGGADFNVTRRVFVRAQYRGLIYNSPTFDLLPLKGIDRYVHRAEPSIGFGYRF
jgi:opacity protein-like surface antigen